MNTEEKMNRLNEVYEEIADLIREASNLVENTPEETRAKQYLIDHINAAFG